MKAVDETVVKIIGVVGWILVGLGSLFSIWLFIKMFSEGLKEPLGLLFFLLLIFCSVAVGMFFVVLKTIIQTLKNIEINTEKK